MRLRMSRILTAVVVVFVCAGLSVLLASKTQTPATKTFTIKARQYAYDPPVINVNRGDSVYIRLSSLDVVHGFYVEGYGIDAEVYPMKTLVRLRDSAQESGFRDVEQISFKADKPGKFRYRCSHTCGYLHPFMQGELVVNPNHPFHAAVGAAFGIFFAGCLLFFKAYRPGKSRAGFLSAETSVPGVPEVQRARREGEPHGTN